MSSAKRSFTFGDGTHLTDLFSSLMTESRPNRHCINVRVGDVWYKLAVRGIVRASYNDCAWHVTGSALGPDGKSSLFIGEFYFNEYCAGEGGVIQFVEHAPTIT